MSKILRPRLDQCPDLTDIYLQAEVQTETHAVSEMRLLSVVPRLLSRGGCVRISSHYL